MSQAGMKQTPVAKSKAEVSAYLVFSGECEAAFKFYEKYLGGKIEMIMTFGDSPMSQQAPAEWRNKVMHARMTVGAYVQRTGGRRESADAAGKDILGGEIRDARRSIQHTVDD